MEEDLDTIIPLKPDVIMPTKVSGGAMIQEVSDYIGQIERRQGMEEGSVKLLPLIETALGVEMAYEIAASDKRVIGLFLGGEDFTADMHCKRTKEGQEIFMPEPVLFVRPEPEALKPMILLLRMWRIWKGFCGIPSLPKAWALQGKQ